MRSLFEKVYGDYIIASMPFDTRKEAYDERDAMYHGREKENTTVWYDSKERKWYIVTK